MSPEAGWLLVDRIRVAKTGWFGVRAAGKLEEC